jgi:hypothetical protein
MFFQQFADENFILNNLHKWNGHDCQISQLSKGSENLNYLIDASWWFVCFIWPKVRQFFRKPLRI